MSVEDERIGRLLRLIRHRSGATQVQVSERAGVPLRDVKAIESGRMGEVRVARVRSVFDAVDGRARVIASWHGAEADRLIDERHAALVERVVRLFTARGWEVFVELSFSEFGERGSIDVFALHQKSRAVAVCEIKSVFGSLEGTNRSLDTKVRLAPTITFKRFGWRPSSIGRLLVVPRDTAILRTIDRHAATMNALYPKRSRDVRAWLRTPTESMAAIWFVSFGRNTTTVPR